MDATGGSSAGEVVALMAAVREGDVKRAERLLESNPTTVNSIGSDGWTALMTAVEQRDVAMVKLLLAAPGIDLHQRTPGDAMSVLHVLAEQDHRNPAWQTKDEGHGALVAYTPILELLVEAGADPNASNVTGETVLHLLCLRGHKDAAAWLLSRKLVHNVDATNAHGDTALHYASRKGYKEIVDLLLEHGASPMHEGDFGTPTQVAGEFQQKVVASQLIELTTDRGLWLLPAEVLVHMLSYLGSFEDLCAVSMVRAISRALPCAHNRQIVSPGESNSRALCGDDSLWRRLGHPSWEEHHVSAEAGWKGAYMTWLRAIAKQYRHKNGSRFVLEATPQEGQPIYSCTIKLLLAGLCGAGKSSLLLRYTEETFVDQHISTIGVDFRIHMCHLRDETVRVQIWDTAGPERFRTITSSYYRGAHGVLLTFDIASRESFDAIDAFAEQSIQYAHEQCVRLMVGCKSDLAGTRAVSVEEARHKAEAYGARYVECSAKTGEGVQEAIDGLVEHIAGGWRSVHGMQTPAYVPDDALFEARCGPKARKQQQQEQPNKKDKCSLQ